MVPCVEMLYIVLDADEKLWKVTERAKGMFPSKGFLAKADHNFLVFDVFSHCSVFLLLFVLSDLLRNRFCLVRITLKFIWIAV